MADVISKPREPRLLINWQISSSDDWELGANGWGVPTLGWRKVVADYLRKWIDWGREADEHVGVFAHLAFGRYTPGDMHLDAWDWAKGSGCTKLFDPTQFADAWAPITRERLCIGYVGHLAGLATQPGAVVGKAIEQNLKPYLKAGFQAIAVDATSATLTRTVKIEETGETFERSPNQVLLSWIDRKFSRRALIEASPRRFEPFAALHARDVVIKDQTWRERHGAPGERKDVAEKNGFGDPSYLKGRTYRLLPAAGGPAAVLAAARRIVADGCVPVVPAYSLMGKVKASEIFAK